MNQTQLDSVKARMERSICIVGQIETLTRIADQLQNTSVVKIQITGGSPGKSTTANVRGEWAKQILSMHIGQLVMQIRKLEQELKELGGVEE